MYDLIIIGAGPSGLTAALYASRANRKVLVLEEKNYGGKIVNAHKIENYPAIESISGFDYATNLYNQVKKLGVEIKFEKVLNTTENKVVKTNSNEYSSKAIIIATGTKNRKLNIENEDKFLGKGISYCATCDGSFYKDKVVAVVGGGNVALEDALYLSDICKKVYIIHRSNEFKAEEKYIDEIKLKENIDIIYNSNINKICGNDVLEKIEIIDNNKNKKNINIEGLFIAIGQEPQNDIFSNLIELDEKGYIKTKDTVHTNVKNIYVAGDARYKNLNQLVTAVSDGAQAALTAINEIM